MMVRRAIEGLDERLDGSSFVARNLKKVFPDHWSFMLGELALYSFVLLILTGTFLAFFYVASPELTVYQGPYEPLQGRSVSLAYDSVLRLSFEVRAGLVMRQTHHWSALVFMASIVAHMIRVFFTGAFRKPRELSWLIGVGLVVAGIMAGFTGYSLPDDLLSGVGLRIAYSIAQSIPFVGSWLANMFFGGEFPGTALLPRLFTLHIFVIPLVILGMISVHLGVVWHQTHTQFKAPGRTNETVTGTPVWPKFAVKSVGLAFVTFAILTLLGGLFQINPVWFYGPYVPYSGPSPSQPDWYAGWLEGLLRLWPNWEFTVFGVTIGELFLPAIVVPGILFTLLATWPFLEARFSKDREWHNFAQHPREAPLRTALGASAIALMVVLFLAGSNDVLAKYLQIEVDTFNSVLKVSAFLLPVIAGMITFVVCRDLRDRPRGPVDRPGTMTVRRTEDGGFEEVHEPATHDEAAAP